MADPKEVKKNQEAVPGKKDEIEDKDLEKAAGGVNIGL
jgi:hypothetical protein